jgi:hypothetical protein
MVNGPNPRNPEGTASLGPHGDDETCGFFFIIVVFFFCGLGYALERSVKFLTGIYTRGLEN